MSGTNTFTAGAVLSAAALNGNFDKLPFSMAVGTASTLTGALADNGEIAVNVTFPASRFTQIPAVMAWTGSRRYIATATTIAAGSATITVRNVSGATGTSETIYYQAIQMTPSSTVG